MDLFHEVLVVFLGEFAPVSGPGPYGAAPHGVCLVSGNKVPVKVRHSVAEEFVVHLVRVEGSGEGCCYVGHVLEEAGSIRVRELVEFFTVPFEAQEGVAFEELVRVQFSDRGAGFIEDQMSWFAEGAADPAVWFQPGQGASSGSQVILLFS